MPYTHKNSKGDTYYLHGKDVTLRNGRQQRIFYFARAEKQGEALERGAGRLRRRREPADGAAIPQQGEVVASVNRRARRPPRVERAAPRGLAGGELRFVPRDL